MKEKAQLPRRQREKMRQRQEILDAALTLFAEKGYHRVTMHEIASEAEFAIGTIYKFFKNKEDLYKALILEKAAEFKKTILEAVESAEDEVEKLRNFVRAKSEIFRAHIPVIRLYFSETHGESFSMLAGLYTEVRQLHGEFLNKLAGIFAKGIEKKRFKAISDPYYLAVALDGITTAFLFLWLEAPHRHPYPENPDDILNILFKGIL